MAILKIKINPNDIIKWSAELRSGKYKQAKEALQKGKNSYCCLGVACNIFIPENKRILNKHSKDAESFNPSIKNFLIGDFPYEQPNSPDWLKKINDDFQAKTGFGLSDLNDGEFICDKIEHLTQRRFTFDEIADLLELVYIHKALD